MLFVFRFSTYVIPGLLPAVDRRNHSRLWIERHVGGWDLPVAPSQLPECEIWIIPDTPLSRYLSQS